MKSKPPDAEPKGGPVIVAHRFPEKPIAVRAEWCGLWPDVFRLMLRYKLPPVLFNILWWLARAPSSQSAACDVDYIEWFSGVQSVRIGKAEFESVHLRMRSGKPFRL